MSDKPIARHSYKIISGGQTGVDRAALDFALENNFGSGGYVPKNRRAEDGVISGKYENLTETATEEYAERTELNVITSDATLILSRGAPVGGALFTQNCAIKHAQPFLHLDFAVLTTKQAAEKAYDWLDLLNCTTLNVAGSRASEDEEIYEITRRFLEKLLAGIN